ncbi:hypothetical protein HZS_2597 [Henneguya salminicola]|nr:hypothetical protein HZS_2597 [Henneguya salminicola]
MEYFVKTKRILEHLHHENLNSEEMDIIKEKILTEIAGKEKIFITNVVASKVIENLLYYTKVEEIMALFISLGDDIPELVKHQYASHVIQRLIIMISSSIDDTSYSEYFQPIISIIKKWIKALDHFYINEYSSHVLRSLIELLGHIRVNDRFQSKGRSENYIKDEALINADNFYVPYNFSDKIVYMKLLKKLCKKFTKITNETDLLTDSKTGILVCYILLATNNMDNFLFQQQLTCVYSRVAIIDTQQSQNIHKILIGNTAPNFLFQILLVFSNDSKIQKKLFNLFIKEHLSTLIQDKVAINTIKTLVYCIKNTNYLLRICKRIINSIKTLNNLSSHHISLMSCIISSCLSLNLLNEGLLGNIIQCFNAKDNIFSSIITMKASCETFLTEPLIPVCCHFISCLFTDIRYECIIQSFMKLSVKEITKLATDPSGSRVMDSFFKNPQILNSEKSQMLAKFSNESFLILAKNKYGSFCIENIWQYLEQNKKIELARFFINNAHFKYNSFGKLLSNKLKLQTMLNTTIKPKPNFKSKNKNKR